ncbi:hypothetical protein B0T26DRAFT_755198 [Lasiosphaeria miniovina]|uniref:Uncharacterized protein n=1 Tax=Lasiosphaeria miniovina TaxID=1954250 RepID=A0AA40A684_9PEZI|nr:uncharacterized protein B0T26DRAFT_755198 [Lasiosphaeria miniovina]KAK0710079.1 hypothetical protein B0T26DRAFT_755198 [Lasiosphaeria miniovina]
MQSADESNAQSATLGGYHVGNILTLRLTGIHGHMLDTSESGTTIRVRIDTEEDWDDAENESFLADESLRLFTTEYTAYDRLSNHQGRSIPRLLAAVDIDIAPPPPGLAPAAEGDFEPFKVQGIILQYLEGIELWDIVKHCPRSSWQGIVDQAVDVFMFREEYESFAQWGMAKETKNEDGAVGLRMQKMLKMDPRWNGGLGLRIARQPSL